MLCWQLDYKCVQRKQITKVLSEIENEGSKLALAEFDSFLAIREAQKRYVIIMKTPALQPSNFKAIKVNGELQTRKRMYSKNISDLLVSGKKWLYCKNKQRVFYRRPVTKKSI